MGRAANERDDVDLWDLTRLLLRRWYFAVPMLLLSVALVIVAAQRVSPDYKAKGYMQMIPAPSSGKPLDPKAKPKPPNPWLDLGYAALGNASALSVTDESNLEKLAASGFSDSVTVVLNERTPLFEIEVVGNSKEQASATVRQIIKLLQTDIAAKQKQYGALAEDTISTLVINDGSSPELESSKVKRVLIVAAGLGLIITTASTIALDYWLRRRSRRRERGDDDDEPAVGADAAVALRAAQRMPAPDSSERTQVIRAAGAVSVPRQAVRTNGNGYPLTERQPAAERQPPANGGRVYQPGSDAPSQAGQAQAGQAQAGQAQAQAGQAQAGQSSPAPDQPSQFDPSATVVLPMSHASWRAQKKKP